MNLSFQQWKLEAIRSLPSDADWWTRRPKKEGERLIPTLDRPIFRGGLSPTVVTSRGALKWQIGQSLALVPGRGQKQVARATPFAIKLQRLQDITEGEAELELVRMWPNKPNLSIEVLAKPWLIRLYAALWDGIYAKRPTLQWAANPEVWALGFHRSETVFEGEAK